MSNLHAYFALRNLQGFSKALDGARSQANTQPSGSTLSSSGGKSWTRANPLSSSAHHMDVNARDWLGRTALHLTCATPEPYALAYVRLLLAHSNINVNVQDTESRWTALHRALYVGNIAASQLLMQRLDIDIELRDSEGFTAFDLYNSTVEGIVLGPPYGRYALKGACGADLFTWGGNRNAALGHGDSDDRTYPDQVVIKSSLVPESTSDRLSPVGVRDVSMAKLHTTVITTEKRGNLRACGFGSGGRLGPGQHTQYSLQPVPQFMHHVVAIALGQDHTLAVTSDGEVFSWGLNRFSQLGYVVEPPTPSGSLHARAKEEPIQAVARKVVGPLKKEDVVGVAACKTASACWTPNDVYTWGTNHGQLGYDKGSQPVQILPRKVTGVQDVSDLAITDTAMACLLETRDVICFRDDGRFRVKFPTPEISDFSKYVHPFVIKPPIANITSCDDTFAALSTRGDVFLFTIPSTLTDSAADRAERASVKPQKVWPLRKSLDPAKDIALGSDGEVILCTAAGHVFVRSRTGMGSASGKALKFHRVPFIHRAVKVCANSAGAFGALRLNYTSKPVLVTGSSLMDDLKSVRPWHAIHGGLLSVQVPSFEIPEDEEGLEADVTLSSRLCALLEAGKRLQKSGGRGHFPEHGRLVHGADIIVQTGLALPAHRVILAARSPVLRDLMGGSNATVTDATITVRYQEKAPKRPRLLVTGCHPITILLILEYLYSDDVPAVWDRRVGIPCGDLFKRLGIDPTQVKTELEIMARMLRLSALSVSLSASVKRVPAPTIETDMHGLFHDPTTSLSITRPDVFLELADKRVACHSVILRARCPFFRSFFDDEDWTIRRWSSDGTLSVDMKHFQWRAVSFALAWLYDGSESELFEHLDLVETVPDLMDAVFSVMAVASELLLDRLMLICSATVLRHITLNNVVSILAEATYYNALSLVDSLQDYVASNLEAIMESRFLDDMHPDLIRSLSIFVRSRQADKAPIMRTNSIAETALRNASSWLELQDIPQPLVRSHWHARDSPKLGPVLSDQSIFSRRASLPAMSPLSSPALDGTLKQSPPRTPKPNQGDDIFAMDVPVDTIPTLHIGQAESPGNYAVPGQAWKSKSSHGPPKANMKTIMAETETATASVTTRSVPSSSGAKITSTEKSEASTFTSPRSFQKPSQRQRRRMDAQMSHPGSESPPQVVSSTSPWKLSERTTSAAASTISVSVHSPQATVPMRAAPPSSSATRIAPQSSKIQPATPMSLLQVSNPSSRPSDAIPDLVPRRRHADAPAWTTVSAEEFPAPAQLSFAAIQQQQRDHVQQPKGKRSLREIQQEEQAKQEEEDFLKWWTAEEQRLKAEATVAEAQFSQVDASSSLKRDRKGHPGRGATRHSRDGRGRGLKL